MHLRLRRLIPTLPVVVLAIAVSTTPAAAHGPDGDMTIVSLQSPDPSTVSIEVGLTYSNDGDLAEDATVEATLRMGSVTVGPEPLEQISGGRYGGDVTVPEPGTWAATVTSTDPAADATGAVQVDPPATTTTAAPSTEATTTTAPPDTTTSSVADDSADGQDDGTSPALVVAVVAGVLALLAGIAVVVLRSGRDDEADDDGVGSVDDVPGDGGAPVPPP